MIISIIKFHNKFYHKYIYYNNFYFLIQNYSNIIRKLPDYRNKHLYASLEKKHFYQPMVLLVNDLEVIK